MRILLGLLAPFFLMIFFTQDSFTFQNSEPVKAGSEEDLDAFMEKVLQKRDIDWERLHNYVFNSNEKFEVRNGEIAALESFHREYVWFVRDGYLVRSPVRVNGVNVSAGERAEAEQAWIQEEKRKRRNKQSSYLGRQTFFRFKFEPGRYLYAGKQQFEGRTVMAIEYYPDIGPGKYENLFEKSILVTLLVLPEEHQIVKFTLNNVGLEFLPARWLVRINDIKASLIMDKPYGDVWLPREITAYGSISTANMNLSFSYSQEYYSYAKTDVKAKFWFDPDASPETHEK